MPPAPGAASGDKLLQGSVVGGQGPGSSQASPHDLWASRQDFILRHVKGRFEISLVYVRFKKV